MIKIEFPSNNKDVALAMGQALLKIAGAEIVKEPCAGSCGANVLLPVKEVQSEIAEKLIDELHQLKADNPTPDGGHMFGDEGDTVAGDEKLITSKAFPGETIGAGEEKAKTDANGVEFNGMFCGKAAKPFYTSGKREGQWKKLKGVGDDAYDQWYAKQLSSEGARTAGTASHGNPQVVNVAAAFNKAEPAQGALVPTTAGELMVWVSERQASGLITAEDVQAAYTAAGCDVGSLFGDDGASYVPAVFAELCK